MTPSILGAVQDYLQGWGYEVGRWRTFPMCWAPSPGLTPSWVLLDLETAVWRLPLVPGDPPPVYGAHSFLTSAGDNMTIVTAMNMGADDLLAKPF